MEKDLLDTFDVARKAADSVSGDDGDSPAVDRCVDALRRLRKIPVTTKVLVDTQVGKRLRALTKHSQDDIRTVASDLFQYWKNLVIEETARDNKKTNGSVEKHTLKVKQESREAVAVKVEKISTSGSMKRKVVEGSESIKVEKRIKSEKVSPYEASKLENSSHSNTGSSSGSETPKLEKKNPKEEKLANVSRNLPVDPNDPPKLTSIVKCNNPTRDKIRELLAEALSRVAKETFEDDREEVRNISDEVEACDPLRVAVTVESAMFGKLGSSTGAQKMKYRSIMFNLKDSNNHDFRRKVLIGQVRPEEISSLSAEDMASDDRKLENKQIKEKALFECERAGAPKASTDQFKCGRCGQRKTTYYQLQTRSADEPMTTFVTCVNCNNHWKFC